jgi:hypothetical protein
MGVMFRGVAVGAAPLVFAVVVLASIRRSSSFINLVLTIITVFEIYVVRFGNILRMIVNIEDVILRNRFDSQIVEYSQKLGAMVSPMIDDMQKHLPQDKVFVLPFRKGLLEQPIIGQGFKILAHSLLYTIPVFANSFPMDKFLRMEWFGYFNASQSAKPCVIHAHEVDNLITNRAMRIGDMPHKLLI